ncbi:class II fructose-bisphosphate aldolase [Chitinophaga pollutisoli]|uniref:Class II fructose-bisphosphate aldolase n=1 Tax=Chitinophaga pollutisoli TaxID=3133966 RepID=A0ABZ2YKP1_9BACT
MQKKHSPTQVPALHEQLQHCHSNGGALLAINFYNFETLKGIIRSATEADSPVILQLTRSSIEYIGLKPAVQMARAMLQDNGITGWLHLDHSDSYDLIHACLDAGFDSVMIDASEKSFEENVAVTRRVVELAERYHAHVEAELGYVAKLGQSKEITGFTEPWQAAQFVEATGVHALAIAIGSAHGFYTAEPRLDMERLSAIHESTPASLVLHGSSGIPHPMLQEAIRRGISKINLATEIKDTFMRKLKSLLRDSPEIDLRKVFPHAIDAVSELVKVKFETVRPRASTY